MSVFASGRVVIAGIYNYFLALPILHCISAQQMYWLVDSLPDGINQTFIPEESWP